MSKAQLIHVGEAIGLAVVTAALSFDFAGAGVGAGAVAVILMVGRLLQAWLVKAQTPVAAASTPKEA